MYFYFWNRGETISCNVNVSLHFLFCHMLCVQLQCYTGVTVALCCEKQPWLLIIPIVIAWVAPPHQEAG